MARKYFGTDGMRGRAGAFPLDSATLRALGLAAGRVLGGGGSTALLATDTRTSGPDIVGDLATGFALSGVTCRSAGVLPTPGAAHLVRGGFTFAVMVTASHNPYEDNGVKFFSADGFKLPDAVEESVEGELDAILASGAPGEPDIGSRPPPPEPELVAKYEDALLASWSGSRLDGLRLVLDCAHGAAHALAPRVFEALGADVVRLGCDPDGSNINRGCGSLHLEGLKATIARTGACGGFAFDGDADRCMAVTPTGRVLDGDYLLYHEARRRKVSGHPGPEGVVGTVMSNLWLERALRREDIPFHRAPVGDRYVLEELRSRGWILGGEPSGHILFLDRATTGDGLLTALTYAALARDSGGMESLAEGIEPCPQTLRNLRVGRRVDLEADGEVARALAIRRSELGDRGRIVLRFSGTEPLLRVMVEAEEQSLVDGAVEDLSTFLLDHLGRG